MPPLRHERDRRTRSGSLPAAGTLLIAIALDSAQLVACVDGFTGCERIVASGVTATRDYDRFGFSEIEISSAFHLDVERSAYLVSVTAGDNVIDRVRVELDGDRPRIGLRSGTSLSGDATLEARVRTPAIDRLELSGASRGEMRGFEDAGDLDLIATGASVISGEVTADRVDVDLSGASRPGLDGAADEADLRASGASRFGGFVLERATVALSGASRPRWTCARSSGRSGSAARRASSHAGDPRVGDVSSSGGPTFESQ